MGEAGRGVGTGVKILKTLKGSHLEGMTRDAHHSTDKASRERETNQSRSQGQARVLHLFSPSGCLQERTEARPQPSIPGTPIAACHP